MPVTVEHIERVGQQILERLDRVGSNLDEMREDLLEIRFERRAVTYFGSVLRRVRVVTAQTFEDILEPHLSMDEYEEVLLLDLLVQGRPRRLPEAPAALLAIEVSATIDRHDVERSIRRAELLRRAGLAVIPVVAGEGITAGAHEAARAAYVAVVQDGRRANWDEAVLEWVSGGS